MKLSVEIMQKCVYDLFLERGWRYFAPNTQAIGWESDLLAISKAYFSAEFEIKISRADYRKDFGKLKHEIFAGAKIDSWHPGPNYFYFVVPEGLVTIDEVPEYAGLIYIAEYKSMKQFRAGVVKEPKKIHRDKVKEHIIYNMARSLMYRHFYKIDTSINYDPIPEPTKHPVQQDQVPIHADAPVSGLQSPTR